MSSTIHIDCMEESRNKTEQEIDTNSSLGKVHPSVLTVTL